ncbi:hypothetical protein LCGC14_2971250 [marine sediment metagenome]|uniref:DUF6036 domain-containing protein n=1 Tax=marine sediment metagenome TaxID=412755 RepID=A0A0F9A0K2_9ZZZZ
MSDMELYTSTPMGAAVIKMFSKLNEAAELLYPEAERGSVRAYIFGGAAVHIYTKARGSHDVDAEIQGADKLRPQDLVVDYEDEDGDPQLLVWDSTYNPTLGPLHEDYIDDAIRLTQDESDILWVYIVSADDLAISKLGRFAEHDRNDIRALAKKGRISSSSLEERAEEAFGYYVGNVDSARGSLELALKDIEKYEDE